MWHYYTKKGHLSNFEADTLEKLVARVVKHNTLDGANEYEGFDRITYLKEDGSEEKMPDMVCDALDEYFSNAAQEDIEELEIDTLHSIDCASLIYDRF